MIVLLAMVTMAWATCRPVTGKAGWWKVEPGPVPCRKMDLGPADTTQVDDLRVVIRETDDSRHRFGLERVIRIHDRWVLHLPELRTGDVLSVDWSSQPMETSPLWLAAEDPPAERHVTSIEQTIRYTLGAGEMTFGPGGNAATTVEIQQTEAATSGGRRAWFPLGVNGVQCEATLGGAPHETILMPWGCATVVPEGAQGQLVWTWGWSKDGASSAGEVHLSQELPVDDAILRIEGVDIAAQAGQAEALMGPGQARFTFHGLTPEGDTGHVTWRVVRAGEQVVLPDRDTVVAQIAQGAFAASIPEPGLGLDFKGRRGDANAMEDVLLRLRGQVTPGALPGDHSLQPRPLLKVRRSRWGTPWELALLLTRYLRQLKLEATPYPVRPITLGDAESGAPVGYTAAVVRIAIDGEYRWMDPSCSVCAVGEVSPSLWGGQVLSADFERMPARPLGHMEIEDDGERVQVFSKGPDAVALRQWLATLPLDQRPRQLAERFGGLGARLVSHDGLTIQGAEIRLVIERQSRR